MALTVAVGIGVALSSRRAPDHDYLRRVPPADIVFYSEPGMSPRELPFGLGRDSRRVTLVRYGPTGFISLHALEGRFNTPRLEEAIRRDGYGDASVAGRTVLASPQGDCVHLSPAKLLLGRKDFVADFFGAEDGKAPTFYDALDARGKEVLRRLPQGEWVAYGRGAIGLFAVLGPFGSEVKPPTRAVDWVVGLAFETEDMRYYRATLVMSVKNPWETDKATEFLNASADFIARADRRREDLVFTVRGMMERSRLK